MALILTFSTLTVLNLLSLGCSAILTNTSIRVSTAFAVAESELEFAALLQAACRALTAAERGVGGSLRGSVAM